MAGELIMPSNDAVYGKEKGTSKKQSTIRPSKLAKDTYWSHKFKMYGWVLVVTASVLLLILSFRQIYPFGENVLRYTDGDQYFGFVGYLQSTFFTSNDPMYSWSTVLGGNWIGILAYYSASPFNLLLALFPDNLMLGYHVIFIIKFLVAALCFAVMLVIVAVESTTPIMQSIASLI